MVIAKILEIEHIGNIRWIREGKIIKCVFIDTKLLCDSLFYCIVLSVVRRIIFPSVIYIIFIINIPAAAAVVCIFRVSDNFVNRKIGICD